MRVTTTIKPTPGPKLRIERNVHHAALDVCPKNARRIRCVVNTVHAYAVTTRENEDDSSQLVCLSCIFWKSVEFCPRSHFTRSPRNDM